MASSMEIAKAYVKARSEKNIATCRELLSEDFRLQSVLGSATNREEALEQIQNPRVEGVIENSMIISEGEYVVHMYDWNVEAPVKGSFSMAENIVIRDGKIVSSQVNYDVASFPEEIRRRLA